VLFTWIMIFFTIHMNNLYPWFFFSFSFFTIHITSTNFLAIFTRIVDFFSFFSCNFFSLFFFHCSHQCSIFFVFYLFFLDLFTWRMQFLFLLLFFFQFSIALLIWTLYFFFYHWAWFFCNLTLPSYINKVLYVECFFMFPYMWNDKEHLNLQFKVDFVK